MFDNLRKTLDFDDLLFEKRNKDYGAYQLRKRYNRVVFASILFSVFIFSALVIIPFLSRPRNEKIISAGYSYVPLQVEDFDIPEEIIVPPAAPPPQPSKVQDAVKYTPPVIVDSVVPVKDLLPTMDEAISMTDETDFTGTGSGEDMLGTGPGIPTDEPFFIVETMPAFKGGDINKFRSWVQQRTNYPQEAIDRKIKGIVILTFVIETDGIVSNVTVVMGVDPLIDNEAVKAIEASPKWTPGFQRGQPVRVRYVIPINFSF